MKNFLTIGNKENKNTDDQQQVSFCNFCKRKAEFRCGLCLQTTYCTPEHQKADWPSHKNSCVRPQDKLKQLRKDLLVFKKSFFDKLSKKQLQECQNICISILKISKQIVQRFPQPMHQIEYGTAICLCVKMQLVLRNFNEAQQILNNYIKQKINFLQDTSLIPSKLKVENSKFKAIIAFIEGKLKLLSVLGNLTHQSSRTSLYVIQILLAHCQKFYGPNSLQASNVYFELANYYYFFMNQQNKACGCYLIAAKMRQQHGISGYYNAAIILIKSFQYQKAIKFLQKCIQMINKKGDTKCIINKIYLALAFCYKKLNHFDNTVEYLQKALCQTSLKKGVDDIADEKKIRDLLRMLGDQYKKQFNNDQIISLPREKSSENEQKAIISNTNFDDYWQINLDNSKKKKQQEWLKSFKNQAQKTKYESKIPMTTPLIQKQLFINHFTDDKNEDIAMLSKLASTTQQINIDLQFMKSLSATQVKYMNELNKLLSINKQKTAIYDIIENSNLMQQLNRDKIQRFYQLNPQLVREKAAYQLINEDQQELQAQKSRNVSARPSKTPRSFKLDLDKLQRLKQDSI